jgi:hypothetical protein
MLFYRVVPLLLPVTCFDAFVCRCLLLYGAHKVRIERGGKHRGGFFSESINYAAHKMCEISQQVPLLMQGMWSVCAVCCVCLAHLNVSMFCCTVQCWLRHCRM